MYKEDINDIFIYNLFETNDINYVREKITNFDYKYKRYLWLKNLNINPNKQYLKENHIHIYKIFNELNNMFNENNIEYYYTSGVLSYFFVNKNLERYHHDLDVFINMCDLEKLEKICEDYGFYFERQLGNRDEYTQRIMLKLYYKDIIEIPITVFMFVREKDLSITQKDYYIDKNNCPLVEYIYNSKEIVDLSFYNKPLFYRGVKYYAITKEALYLSKNGNRHKDIYDCQIFSKSVDANKLEALKVAYANNKNSKVFYAFNDNYYSFMFQKNNRKSKVLKNDRL